MLLLLLLMMMMMMSLGLSFFPLINRDRALSDLTDDRVRRAVIEKM